jgi:Family of unknown function (DUF6459)
MRALPPERPGCPKAPGERRPLPDPAAVRLCLVPDSAPPYDDEIPAGEPPGLGWATMGPARLTAMPTTPTTRGPATGGPPEAGRPGAAGPGTGGPGAARPGAGGPGAARPGTGGPGAAGPGTGGPETGRPGDGDRSAPGWQSRFAQVLAETLAGSRPPRQIQPWTTQQAREHIQRLGPRMASAQRPRVRRVVTYRPASDVMEMAVVVGFGSRVKALAVRLERSAVSPPAKLGEPAGRWVCTAVEAA